MFLTTSLVRNNDFLTYLFISRLKYCLFFIFLYFNVDIFSYILSKSLLSRYFIYTYTNAKDFVFCIF